MPSLHSKAGKAPVNISYLEIVAFYSSNQPPSRPTLDVQGNLMEISSSLTLSGITVTSSSPNECISTLPYLYSTITTTNTVFSCKVMISDTGTFSFGNGTEFTNKLTVAINNSTLTMKGIILSDADFNAWNYSTIGIQNAHFGAMVNFQLKTSSLSISGLQANYRTAIVTNYNEQTDKTMPSKIEIDNSCFREGLALKGLYWDASIQDSCFYSSMQWNIHDFVNMGVESYETYAHYAPNAAFSAVCGASLQLINNRFWTGTLFFDLPYQSLTDKNCPGVANPFKNFTVERNQFKPFKFQKMIYGKYIDENSPVLPALSVITPSSPFVPVKGSKVPQHLNFPRNWWGDVSGPYLCCNSAGKGGFVTPFANVSEWCRTPDCKSLTYMSTRTISSTCFLQGCAQPLAKGFIPVTSVIASIGLVVTLVAIIVSLILQKKQFSPEQIQYLDSDEVLKRGLRIFYLGLISSTFASVTVVVTMTICIHASVKTYFAPLQQVVTLATFALFIAYLVVSCIQILCNLFLASALHRRSKFKTQLPYFLRGFWTWNCVALIFIVITAFSWLPNLHHSSRASTEDLPMVQGQAMWLLSSSHNLFLLTGIIVSLFSLLASMVPGRFVHNLICHPEYTKISTSLEASLLQSVVKIPRVKKLSSVAAYVSYGAIPIGLALFGLQLAIAVKPEIFNGAAPAATVAFIPSGIIRIRFAMGTAFTGIGNIAIMLCLWAAKHVRKVGLYSVLNFVLIVCFASGASVVSAFWSNLKSSLRVSIPFITLEVAYLLCVAVLFFLYRSIRRIILEQLPSYAREGLNDHADEHWHNSTSKKGALIGETSPLLVSHTLGSSDEQPLSSGEYPNDM